MRFYTHLHPSSKSLRKILREPFHPWGLARKSWIHLLVSKFFVPLIYIRNKIWNVWLTLCAPSWNYTKNTKTRFQPALNKTLCPKLPPPNRWKLKHSNNNNNDNKIRPRISLPHWFLTEGSQHQNRKANSYSPLSGNNVGPLNWNTDLLTIRPPLYTHWQYSITWYKKYQIPVVKTCWRWTFLKQCNITQPPFFPPYWNPIFTSNAYTASVDPDVPH